MSNIINTTAFITEFSDKLKNELITLVILRKYSQGYFAELGDKTIDEIINDPKIIKSFEDVKAYIEIKI
jgi:hypothetical protein